VLLRLTNAAREFGADVVINCTADNPLVSPEYARHLADYHVANHHDYSKTEELPFGTFSYVLSVPAMEKACKMKEESDTEVWGGYFTQTGAFRWGAMEVDDPAVRWPELRLTVDTPEDFQLMESIFEELYRPGNLFSLSEVVELCRERPELLAINADVAQKAGIPIRYRRTEETHAD
jgi:spore coat polysaccharide biosynthesis protein SpsF